MKFHSLSYGIAAAAVVVSCMVPMRVVAQVRVDESVARLVLRQRPRSRRRRQNRRRAQPMGIPI